MSSRLISSALALAGILVLFPLPSSAQGKQASEGVEKSWFPPAPGEEKDPILHPSGRKMELTLEECLAKALKDNIYLGVDKLNPPMARAEITAASGFFDPAFYLSPLYQEAQTAPRTVIRPSMRSKSYGFRTGFKGKVLTGAVYDLSFDYRYNRYESPTPTPTGFGVSFFSQWSAGLGLRISQPLLRGAWVPVNRTEITRAEIGAKAAEETHEDLVQQTLLRVTEAYWGLVFARENYRVRKISLALAKEQLSITNNRIKAALAPEVARVADQADIAKREEDLIQAENQVLAAEDALKLLVFPFRDNRDWRLRLVPTSPLEEGLDFPIPRPEEAAAVAMKRRRDLEAARLRVEDAKTVLRKAKSEYLPQLNVVGSYYVEDVDPHTEYLWGHMRESKYPAWALGLEFSIPLGNRFAKGFLRKAELGLEKARKALRLKEVGIWKEIRDAVRNLGSLRKEIEAARESVRLARTNLRVEEEKYKAGKSIIFEVQRRNEALAAARTRLARAIVQFKTGLARLKRAMGLLPREETPAETKK